jgi:uncharacterized protein YhfF
MWNAYLASLPDAGDAARRWYEVFRVGDSPVDADAGAALISNGVKTATSSLLWSYAAAGKAIPAAGSLSIVADGEGNAVCVVETVAVEVKAFDQVDAAFALDYGEWDRTLETWRQRSWAINVRRCARLGRVPVPAMPLVCERIRVVYPQRTNNRD